MIFINALYMMLFSRLHGGGFFSAPRWLRNFIYAMPYAVFSPLAFALAFVGKNLGHYEFWWMGFRPTEQRDSIIGDVLERMSLQNNTLLYCVTGMAIKGAIIGAGTLTPGVILGHAVALPLAYYIGNRTRYGTELAEYLSGLFCGLTFFL